MHAPARDLAPLEGEFAFAGRQAALAALATALYVVATFKYQMRDPLSTQAGFQAALEILLVSASFGLAVLITAPRALLRHLTPTVIGFLLFACLAMLCSVFSFWPQLSLIKGGLLAATICIAALLCASRPPATILTYTYWAIFAMVVIGAIARPLTGPLFDTDDYSGRIRFTMFALHYGSLADYVAYVFLIGRLLPRRPHWTCQGFLLLVNLAAGARASSGSLIAVLLVEWLWHRKLTIKAASRAAFAVAAVALLVLLATSVDLGLSSIPYEQFYGDKVTVDELVTLNNRTGLWVESFPLVPGSLVFGYGVEGMRAALLSERDWAGHSHNAYLELLFSSGLPGLFSFMVAWGSAVFVSFRIPTNIRIPVLGLHGYMFMCGLTDPNLMLLQFFPIFLIVCLDAFVRAKATAPDSGETVSRKMNLAPRTLSLQLHRRTT